MTRTVVLLCDEFLYVCVCVCVYCCCFVNGVETYEILAFFAQHTSLTPEQREKKKILTSSKNPKIKNKSDHMSSKSKTQFLKLLKEYRSDPKVSYAELIRNKQLSAHERRRDELQKAFKIMVRETSFEELAECLDALMKKWQKQRDNQCKE